MAVKKKKKKKKIAQESEGAKKALLGKGFHFCLGG